MPSNSQEDTNKFIHDIRNPLNTISMNAELGKLMLEKEKPIEDVIEVLERIVIESKKASEILERF